MPVGRHFLLKRPMFALVEFCCGLVHVDFTYIGDHSTLKHKCLTF